jgi:hypothetical protein
MGRRGGKCRGHTQMTRGMRERQGARTSPPPPGPLREDDIQMRRESGWCPHHHLLHRDCASPHLAGPVCVQTGGAGGTVRLPLPRLCTRHLSCVPLPFCVQAGDAGGHCAHLIPPPGLHLVHPSRTVRGVGWALQRRRRRTNVRNLGPFSVLGVSQGRYVRNVFGVGLSHAQGKSVHPHSPSHIGGLVVCPSVIAHHLLTTADHTPQKRVQESDEYSSMPPP